MNCPGVRAICDFLLSSMKGCVQIDLAIGSVANAVKTPLNRLLYKDQPLMGPDFSLLTYPPEMIFAEKLQIAVSKADKNTRMRDYYDMFKLTQSDLDPVRLSSILEAIFDKPFALIGFLTGLILIPLAITSTKGWMKRLGKNWRRIHWLVYAAGLLAVLHYAWSVKSDIRQPVAFGVVVLLLLVARIPIVRNSLSRFRWKFASKLSELTNPVRKYINNNIPTRG